MSTLVTYKSSYGATRSYAEWIAARLSAELVPLDDVQLNNLGRYDLVVAGASIYAAQLAAKKTLRRLVERRAPQPTVLFTVGLVPPHDEAYYAALRRTVGVDTDEIKWFHFQGRLDQSQLGTKHRMMMKLVHSTLGKKAAGELSEQDQILLSTFDGPRDFTDPGAVDALVDHVRTKLSWRT